MFIAIIGGSWPENIGLPLSIDTRSPMSLVNLEATIANAPPASRSLAHYQSTQLFLLTAAPSMRVWSTLGEVSA